MTNNQKMSSIQPVTIGPEVGEVFDVGSFHIVTRIRGEQTRGTFEHYYIDFAPGTVDYHIHRTMDETLCLIEGGVEFMIAGKSYVRSAGSVTYVPMGVHHGFINHGPAQAKLLVFFSPSGSQDEYFRELVRLFKDGDPNPDELKAVRKRYDQELVDFP